MKLTSRDPVMRGVSFLLDALEMGLARCDQRRIRCDLPGVCREVRELAAVVDELTELCGAADLGSKGNGEGEVPDQGPLRG